MSFDGIRTGAIPATGDSKVFKRFSFVHTVTLESSVNIMITTWHILILSCAMAPLGPALTLAARTKSEFVGYVLLIIPNLVLGLCCAWMLDAFGAFVYARVQEKSEAVLELSARVGHAVGVIWLFFEIYLGDCLSSAILPLVH